MRALWRPAPGPATILRKEDAFVFTETTTDPRAWRADTVDGPRSWYLPLPARCRSALEEIARAAPPEVAAVTLAGEVRAGCAEALAPALAALEGGRGFVVVRGPQEPLSDDRWRLLYWLVGQALGRPVEQNVEGQLLYDVRDTGRDVRAGARFSVTNYESSFHTDASFAPGVVDYVGLLCLRTARSGGVSQLVSGHAVYQRLRERHPDALRALGQPFHVDRRGGVRPGEAPTVRVPVVCRDESGLTWRYLRYWIEAGHEKAQEPLTPAQRDALDVLDETLRDPALRVEFNLAPGDLFFLNNRWLLHNRTAFEDHAEPEKRRHLVRLWLSRR
jgi:alpha-ketoglutarate-dependent taurine dioxygenase